MYTVAVVNSKGGVGKTTLASSLAVCAAQEARVAMVDLDPQKSLVEWWKRRRSAQRGGIDSPTIFEGVDDPADAVERARLAEAGYDWLILDGPPAFLHTLEAMIAAADFVLIPVKPTVADLLGSEDAVVIARDAGAAYLVCFNDVGAQERERVVKKAKEALFSNGVQIAKCAPIIHRVAHINGMNNGKGATELKDKNAAAEIAELWAEVKAATIKAAKARARKMVAHG